MATYFAAAYRAKRSISMLALVAALLVVALFVGVNVTSAQVYPNPQYQGPGQFCVDDAGYPSGANCTANDTRISGLTPSLTDVCTAIGDTATAQFTANLVIGASTRYDLAMYIATNGGNAEIGNSCYKDVLQPVAALDAAGNPTNPAGIGPFKNEDGDLCGEANQSVGAVYKLQQTLQILCVDNNNDGVVDPISTCLSWANNASQFSCQGVTALVPGPGTSSKCNCESIAPNPPILLYRGYDFGDLPISPIDYGTTLPTGAQHAVQDTNNDGTPNAQGGTPAVWLGTTVDFGPNFGETNGQPSTGADGDDTNASGSGTVPSDEDGVSTGSPGTWSLASASFNVTVSGTLGACPTNNCRVAIWIDWGRNGPATFDQVVVQNVGLGTTTVTFDPSTTSVAELSSFYVRVRLYDPNPVYVTPSPTGLVLNGEVEDYAFNITPTAVTLADFYAEQVADFVRLTWETNSELNNRGFNLYRGVSAAGPDRQLNATLIPSQSQGSPGGFVYTWDDHADLAPGTTYFYWVEDVDLAGATTMHGPVSVDYTGPTAVTVSGVDANPAAANFAVPLAVTLAALLAPLAAAVAVRRRRA